MCPKILQINLLIMESFVKLLLISIHDCNQIVNDLLSIYSGPIISLQGSIY